MTQKDIKTEFDIALAMQRDAANLGFDWDDAIPVINKAREELDELMVAIQENDADNVVREFGDLLFVMANLSRHLDASMAQSLSFTNEKFRQRFDFVKSRAASEGVAMQKENIVLLERYWNEAKDSEST